MHHLSRAWHLAATPHSAARLQHTFLPEDPVEAHQLLVGLSGHTARRYSRLLTAEEATGYDHARLADIAGNEGFSHHPLHGAAPEHGWMASYEDKAGSGVGQVHKMSELTPEHLASHRQTIAPHLAQPRSYQGAWHDTSTGDVYLDASRHFDHEHEAKDFAAKQKQKAIFHLGDFTERFMDPHQDPLREKDHGEWKARYGGNTSPHPGFKSYSHLYPDTDEQAAARGQHTGGLSKSASAMAGRVAHPGQGHSYAEQVMARRRGYL